MVAVSQSEQLLPPPGTSSESVTYHTQRHRALPPGEIAHLPTGHGLLLHGTHWGLLHLTPWHQTQPWTAVAAIEHAHPDTTPVDHLDEMGGGLAAGES